MPAQLLLNFGTRTARSVRPGGTNLSAAASRPTTASSSPPSSRPTCRGTPPPPRDTYVRGYASTPSTSYSNRASACRPSPPWTRTRRWSPPCWRRRAAPRRRRRCESSANTVASFVPSPLLGHHTDASLKSRWLVRGSLRSLRYRSRTFAHARVCRREDWTEGPPAPATADPSAIITASARAGLLGLPRAEARGAPPGTPRRQRDGGGPLRRAGQ